VQLNRQGHEAVAQPEGQPASYPSQQASGDRAGSQGEPLDPDLTHQAMNGAGRDHEMKKVLGPWLRGLGQAENRFGKPF